MAGERRINFGADATDARYAIEDTGNGANFILARDTTGGTVLLEYDDAAGEWVNRGGVDMDGNDISNVGTVNANSVSTDSATINGTPAQDPRELVAFVDTKGNSQNNFSLTFDVQNQSRFWRIEILLFDPRGTSDRDCQLDINNLANGDYNETLESFSGANSTNLSANRFSLLKNVAPDPGAAAAFELHTLRNRPALFGNGSARLSGGDFLIRGGSKRSIGAAPTVTISADSTSETLNAVIAVWSGVNRRAV